MKILVMPGKGLLPLSEVKNFSGMWRHYIHRELEAAGCELIYDNGLPVNPADTHPDDHVKYFTALAERSRDIDHVLGGSRYFTRVPQECTRIMQRAVKGSVTQIHDGPLPKSCVDTTFSIRDDGPERMAKATYIGWAADPAELPSKQDPFEFRILIDHPHYHVGHEDWTNEITASALRLKMMRPKLNVVIHRFCDGGVEVVNTPHPVPIFHRVHIPFVKIAEEYSKAHVFCVTHIESLGLSVLESAMAGALVVAPARFIEQDRLATVRHLVYRPDDGVPWDEVLRQVDPGRSRIFAMENSWQAVAKRIVRYWREFQR